LLSHDSGFSEFAVLDSRPMDASQISAAVLERVADYCAFRALEFGAPVAHESQLEAVARFNVAQEFGCEIGEQLSTLNTDRVIVTDGRMLPHEWLLTPGGAFVKTDGDTHGDDHFFPGPADIAWDLAGAIVEWSMTTEAAQYMLDRYRRRSGDDPRARIDAYLLAYTVFRMAYCGMAGFAMHGSAEEQRLRRTGTHYRNLVQAQLRLRMPERKPVRSAPKYVRAQPAETEPESRAS
jgi:hypothetical protein